MIRGSVDVITTKTASGWIFTDMQKDPLTVEAVINQEIVGGAIANVSRPDLAAAGFGNGKCGFELRFGNDIDPLFLPFVKIRMGGTDLELPRWVGAGFGEYFGALHERFPRAGRAASVYGGLWTDRTDGASILKGKLDTGVIQPRDANNVARFVHDGVLSVVRGDSKISPKTKIDDVPSAIAAMMFDEAILRILCSILDDNPVAIRADALETDEATFSQISGLEDLPSPAECLGLIIPLGTQSTSVEIVRGGHRFPEFMQNGMSRWTYEGSRMLERSLDRNLPVDRYTVPLEGGLIVGAGAICRIRAGKDRLLKVLVLPSRLSLLRFQRQAPRGELAHGSGARIWV